MVWQSFVEISMAVLTDLHEKNMMPINLIIIIRCAWKNVNMLLTQSIRINPCHNGWDFSSDTVPHLLEPITGPVKGLHRDYTEKIQMQVSAMTLCAYFTWPGQKLHSTKATGLGMRIPPSRRCATEGIVTRTRDLLFQTQVTTCPPCIFHFRVHAYDRIYTYSIPTV